MFGFKNFLSNCPSYMEIGHGRDGIAWVYLHKDKNVNFIPFTHSEFLDQTKQMPDYWGRVDPDKGKISMIGMNINAVTAEVKRIAKQVMKKAEDWTNIRSYLIYFYKYHNEECEIVD